MTLEPESLDAKLIRIVGSTPWLVDILDAVRAVDLPDCFVAAGAIRNTVWDFLDGRASPAPLGDVDVVYFDALDDRTNPESLLRARLPQYRWEVTNQATVHRWQSAALGRPVLPYRSIGAAVASWPETATALGVRRGGSGAVDILAPFGLEDLFGMIVRPSPTLVDADAYRSRARDKGWMARWPRLTVVPL